MKPERCDVARCDKPKFYANGEFCLAHTRKPPKSRRPEVDDESESSDDTPTTTS